jgi:hypothetical protein
MLLVMLFLVVLDGLSPQFRFDTPCSVLCLRSRLFFYEQNDNNLDYNSKVKEDFKENSLIRSTYNK